MNKEEFLKRRYDPVNNKTIFYQNDSRIKTALSFLDDCVGKNMKVLDVGCYNGEIAVLIRDIIGKGCEMHGIDIAENTITEAKKKGILAKKANLNDSIDFSDNTFDLIFAGEIIEHIYDTDLFVSELKRVLKPDGILIITTPNFLSFGRRLLYLLGVGIFMEASLSYPEIPEAAGHIRFFTKKLLVDYLSENDFSLVKYSSDTVNFPNFKINFLAKIFPTIGHAIIGKFRNIK